MTIKRHLPLVMLLLVAAVSCSFPSLPDSINVKNWKISYDQDESIPTAAGKDGWSPVSIPSKFRLANSPVNDFQFAWLRAEFIVDKPEKYYGISFGRIHHIYKIYINDYLLDYKTPDEIGNLHLPVNMIIPRDTVNPGMNKIYIRLGIYRAEPGGLPDGVLLQPKTEFHLLKHWQDFLFNQLPLAILMLLFIGIIRMLVLFVMERREMFFLYTALMLSLNSVYIITIFSPHKLVGFRYIPSILIMAAPLVVILFVLIIQSLYRVKLHGYNRVMFPIIIIVMISTLLIQKYSPGYFLKSMIALLFAVLFIPFISYMIYRLDRIKHDRFKFYATMILANAMMVCGILEIIFYIMGSTCSLLIATYFAPFLMLGFAILGTQDYRNRIVELRLLYDKLAGGRREPRKQAVTDSTGEKIRSIIDFINDNYKSDISREGLALAVDMNPNYFSSQFREYTGKKISDYINELRIKDAANRIMEEDVRIIDIALSAGFESLSTFNRLFKSIMGKSPTEFRRQ